MGRHVNPPIRGTALSAVNSRMETKIHKEEKIPAAYGKVIKNNPPKVSERKGIITIHHTEYVADVDGSIQFDLKSLAMNPGSDVFPWLSQEAQSWEHYRFKRLAFRYCPVVGTTTSGQIGMAPDFNPNESDAPDFITLMSAMGATRGQVFLEQECVIDASTANETLTPWRLVRHRNEVVVDTTTYDVGTFQYATHLGSNSLVGSLYVDYIVQFRTPQVQRPIVASANKLVGNRFTAAGPIIPAGTSGPVSLTDFPINTLIEALVGDQTTYSLPAGTYDLGYIIPIDSSAISGSEGVESIHLDVQVDGNTVGENVVSRQYDLTSLDWFPTLSGTTSFFSAVPFLLTLILSHSMPGTPTSSFRQRPVSSMWLTRDANMRKMI